MTYSTQTPPVLTCLLCVLPSYMTMAMFYQYATTTDPHHSFVAFARHQFFGAEDVVDVPLNRYGVPAVKSRQWALFLYNSTMPHHMEFMHDVRVANWKHDLDIFKADCVKEARLCGERGHGRVHEYEPPIIFYHHGEWSEAFHDDIQVGKVSKPTTRSQRVKAVVSWLDRAASGAGAKLQERERFLSSNRGMAQQLMEKRREDLLKKAKEEEKGGERAEL